MLETTESTPNLCVTYSSSEAGPSRLSQMVMFAALECDSEAEILIAGERSLGGVETPSTGEFLEKEFPEANVSLIDDGTRLINTVLQMRAVGEAGVKEVGKIVCFEFHKQRVTQALGWAGVKFSENDGVITVEDVFDKMHQEKPEELEAFLHDKLGLNKDVHWPNLKISIEKRFKRREWHTRPVQSLFRGRVLNMASKVLGHGRYDDLKDDGTPILSHTREVDPTY